MELARRAVRARRRAPGGRPPGANVAADRLVTDGRRADADEQLERALAFWRSVGATRYVAEAEALGAKAAAPALAGHGAGAVGARGGRRRDRQALPSS